MVTGKCTDVFRGIFLLGELREGLRERIFPWRNFSWGKRLSMEGAQDFLALFKKKKKTVKNKNEKLFLLKVRSSIKTENEQTL